MKPVLEAGDLDALAPAAFRPEDWTAVVPAAGRGTRLAFPRPKLLYPLGGLTILERLESLLAPLCRERVYVVSPEGRAEVAAAVGSATSVRLAVQERPLGMADAVWAARPLVRTPGCLVVWGDQAGLRPETLRWCLKAHAARPGALLTLPTRIRERPYIRLVRDGEGRIAEVRQAREGAPSERGENDAGAFLFDSAALFDVLSKAREEGAGRGGRTGELNLLPLLPRFERGPGSVVTLRIAEEEETIGVNTEAEARRLEAYLEARAA